MRQLALDIRQPGPYAGMTNADVRAKLASLRADHLRPQPPSQRRAVWAQHQDLWHELCRRTRPVEGR